MIGKLALQTFWTSFKVGYIYKPLLRTAIRFVSRKL